MLAVAGYYDGMNVQLLEKAPIKKNQRLIITVMDDFVSDSAKERSKYSEKKSAAFERLEAWREKNCKKSQNAYQTLLSYRKPGIGSGDYKKDLTEMLEKKYASID